MESATRWSAREDATVALSSSLNEIIDLLRSIAVETGRDEENLETRTKAGNLLRAMQRYDFFALLTFWCRLLHTQAFRRHLPRDRGLPFAYL